MRRGQASQVVGEFLAIVLGVLAALAIDEWRGEVARFDQEVEYLTRLVDDLNSDLTRIRFAEQGYRELEETLLTLRQVLRAAAPSLPEHSPHIAIFLGRVGGVANPRYSTGTFEDLRSSGNTILINRPLTRTLLRYYGQRDRLEAQARASDERRELVRSFMSYDDWRAHSEYIRASLASRREGGVAPEPPPLPEEQILRAMRRSGDLTSAVDQWLRDAYRLANDFESLALLNRNAWERLNGEITSITNGGG